MSFIAIKNWSEHQHYKDRTAPWIKLYRDMLDSEMWVMSSDASKLLAICLMMLALRNDNKIPADPEYIKRFGHLEFLPDFAELIKHKFIDFIDENGECLQPASAMLATCPTEERRTEGEKNRTEGEGEETPATSADKKTPKPKTISPLEILLSLGVEEQAAKDWLTVRKAKRAPLTETALDELKLEAGKAGITVGQAVEICAKKSWQGFNAGWNWNDSKQKSGAISRSDQIARHNEQVAAEFLGSGEKTIEAEVVNA